MRPRPDRLERLPDQYFAALLGRVAEAARAAGEPLIDLGRGNPDVPPPAHVVERLAAAAAEPTARVHGYPPFRGLPELREAVADRYRVEYGVELDPHREVVVLPGTKTALVELQLVLAERGDTVLLPDPGYPDYRSGAALAGAAVAPLPLDPAAGWAPDFEAVRAGRVAAAYLNYPSNPCAVAAPEGAFAAAVRFAERTGAAIVHDFAYGDLVFDGRRPASFLAEPGAKDVGVEMFSMSKSYGMAGWRLGFVVGNAEIVARVNLLSDHVRAGVFAPVQEAAVAALTGPQETIAERRDLYERRRDRVRAALGSHLRCEGSFYVWLELPPNVTADALLLERRVALAPGEGFGARGAGFARLSLATADELLDEGLARLAPVFASAYPGLR
jgi:aminotransferase